MPDPHARVNRVLRVRSPISREAWLRVNLPHLHVGLTQTDKLHVLSAGHGQPLCGRDPQIVDEGPLEDYTQALCKNCALRQGDDYAQW